MFRLCLVIFILLRCDISSYEMAIGSMFRNEAPYLKEWIDYHIAAGVEHFWLYNDRSVDDWQEVLQPYIDSGVVEVFDWPSLGDDFYIANQVEAFRDAIQRAADKATWLALIDADEFILPMRGRSISECLNTYFSSASAVYANWRNFGTGGQYIPLGEPILFQLTATSERNHSHNGTGKSIVRPKRVDIANVWYPHHFPLQPGSYYLNGKRQQLFFNGLDLPTDGKHHDEYIRINHYVLRDEYYFQNVRLTRSNLTLDDRRLLFEHYDAFQKTYDDCIIQYIRKNFPADSQQPWENSISEASYVIGGLLGQLGNQMFEVATTCAVAWDNNAKPYFPDFAPVAHYSGGSYQHIFFRCKIAPPSPEIDCEWQAPPYGYIPIQFQNKMKLSGYFQNEKYFAHHRDRLLQLFAPRPDDLSYIKGKYSWIIDHPNTVSVHLRYYYAEKPDEDAFIQYDWEYYEKAMALFPDNSLFVVTSDNLSFARENIPTQGKNVIFIEGEPYFIDFYLQSFCKHQIISNSTFSWWSAWLNRNPNKIVVRPQVWLGGYPDIGGPENWIRVDAQGMQARQRAKNEIQQFQ